MVVVAYLGWAAYGATAILFSDRPPSFSTTISGAALAALGISWTLFAIQKYPLTFYVYVTFPCYFWREALVASSGPLLELYRSGKLRGSVKLLFRAGFVTAALQSMVVRITVFYTLRGTSSAD
jgi:phosphatidylinositol glycan class N